MASPLGASMDCGRDDIFRFVVEDTSGSANNGEKTKQGVSHLATDTRFPVLVSNLGEYGDLDVSKAISGKADRGIGLVFRFRDPKSYYIIRANALEDNFRLYRMVDGERLQFADSNVKVPANQWHTIRVVARGDHITCWFDGK